MYTNDKKAVRMKKGPFSKMVVTTDLYKRFLKKYPEYEGMTWGEFFSHWKEIAKTIREEAITNPLGVKLGCHNGEIKYQYIAKKDRMIDVKASYELGREVPLTNILTGGKTAMIKWERRIAQSYNKMLGFYAFEETREMTKLSTAYIREHPERIRASGTNKRPTQKK